jgi:hypothetical protein
MAQNNRVGVSERFSICEGESVTSIKLTKIEVARRQIEAAIETLFAGDPVAAHTLAAAGSQIVRDLCKANNVVGFEEFEDWIKPEFLSDFWRNYNRSASSMKHAKRDPSAIIVFNPQETEYALLFAIKWFRDLGNKLTPRMVVFLHWFGACHPHIIADNANDLRAQALQNASQHAQNLDHDTLLKIGADLLAKADASKA